MLAMAAGATTHAHAGGPVSHFVFSPNPIATFGTLAPSATVPVTVTAEDSTNTPVPGSVIWLTFTTPAGATATVGTTGLTRLPQPFTADSSGQVAITYTASATPPANGIDRLAAKNTKSKATITAHDEYSYSGVHKYSMQPKPIAATGTLAGGATVNITLRAISSTGAVIPNAKVFLAFAQTTGGGTATSGGKTLGTTPMEFTTSSSGTLTIVYHTPLVPPVSGTDTITADNAATKSSVASTDSYTF